MIFNVTCNQRTINPENKPIKTVSMDFAPRRNFTSCSVEISRSQPEQSQPEAISLLAMEIRTFLLFLFVLADVHVVSCTSLDLYDSGLEERSAVDAQLRLGLLPSSTANRTTTKAPNIAGGS